MRPSLCPIPAPTSRVPPHPTVRARVAQHAVTTQQVIAHERGDAILSLPPSLQHLRLRFGRRLPGEIVDFWGKKGTRDLVRSPKQVASRTPQPRTPQLKSSPAPFRAMLPVVAAGLNGSDAQAERLSPAPPPPWWARDESGNDAQRLPGRRDAPSEACLLQTTQPSSRPQREPSRRGFPAVTPHGSGCAGAVLPAGSASPGVSLSALAGPLAGGQWRHHCNTLANSGRPLARAGSVFRPQYLPLQPARRASRDHSHFLYLSAYLHVWCPSLSIPCLP